jgi:dTDP-4-amino-4,6-dideoxygalactose transaminase
MRPAAPRRRPTYLVFGQPKIEQAEIDEVVDTLRSGWIGTGPKAAEFERRFAEYCNVASAVAVSSCTAGMHLCLLEIGAASGVGVITSPLTFPATVNVILHTGARPFLVDVDRATMNLSPTRLRQFLERDCIRDARTGRPQHRQTGADIRAVIPVHFAGRPCDMDAIASLATEHGLTVIEDAAHAIEARYHGRKVGGISPFTCFSFYATKNLTTGEGGMVTLTDTDVAAQMKIKTLHGISQDAWSRFESEGAPSYEVVSPGYKYNMTDIQASIGLHQLARIESNLRRREEIWARYDRELEGLPIELPAPVGADSVHARHLYTVLVDEKRSGITRDDFRRRLHQANIGTGVHFIAIHLHDYYRRRLGYSEEDLPEASHISARTVSLPLSPNLTEDDVDDVLTASRTSLVP